MQTLYIHIGYHKTGTTSLQSIMNQNRERLLELGVFYPDIKGDGSRDYFHKHLAFYIALNNANRNGGDFSEPIGKITDQIMASGAPAAMISEESFSGSDRPVLDALSKFRANFNVKVIAVLRRQDRFLQSFYQQSIKDFGEKRDFSKFLKDSKWHRLYYDVALGHWADRFGLDNIHVFSYDLSDIDRPINRCILDLVLNGRRPEFSNEARVWNTSLPSVCYEALKYLNRSGAPKSDRLALIDTLRKCLRSGRTIDSSLVRSVLTKEYLTPKLSQVISDVFCESNARTAGIYFDCINPFPGMDPHSSGGNSGFDDIEVTGPDFAPKDVVGMLSHFLVKEQGKLPPKAKQ